MRVQAVVESIYGGLRALDWRRYLCAMWIVCGELRAVYDDRWSDDERLMMTSTLEVVREVVMAGRVTAAVSIQAKDLYEQWRVKTVEHGDEVMPGQWNTWVVFRDLAGEIAETSERWQYVAAERVDLAATDRWRESQQGPLYEDPDEEIDDSSPMARVLTVLHQTVTGVAGMMSGLRGEAWDPATVRTRLFG